MRKDKEYWEETIERYRASKLIRTIRRNKDIGTTIIGQLTGKSKQYVNNVQEIIVKPSEEFIKKLEDINDK
jgi:hypothetical protein